MLGLETVVEIAQQVDASTFNVTARKALNVYGITGGRTKTRPEDPILNGGFNNLTDPTEPGPGLDDHRVTVVVPVCVAQFPYWLRAFFGAPTTTGSASDYTHAFASGVAALPYISLQDKLQTNDFRRHVGMVGQEMRISLDPSADGFARATLTFIGINEERAASAAAGTVTAAPALDRPAESRANIMWNAVAGGQIIGGELVFTRKLKRIRSADATGLANRIELDGKSTLGGSLKLRYQNQTILADGWNRTERATVMELLKSATRGFRLTCAHALLDETPVDRGGPDGVELDVPLAAYQSASNPALKVEALSSIASLAAL